MYTFTEMPNGLILEPEKNYYEIKHQDDIRDAFI